MVEGYSGLGGGELEAKAVGCGVCRVGRILPIKDGGVSFVLPVGDDGESSVVGHVAWGVQRIKAAVLVNGSGFDKRGVANTVEVSGDKVNW